MLKGSEIKRLREEREIAQGELAELSGCSQQTIASIEKGHTERSGYVFAIARALDCALSDIETEVPPLDGELYVAAAQLKKMDNEMAERFLLNFIETLKAFNKTTSQQIAKISRFPARSNPTSKRRRPRTRISSKA